MLTVITPVFLPSFLPYSFFLSNMSSISVPTNTPVENIPEPITMIINHKEVMETVARILINIKSVETRTNTREMPAEVPRKDESDMPEEIQADYISKDIDYAGIAERVALMNNNIRNASKKYERVQ